MKSLTITSTRTAAGKTTVGLGIALNTDKKIGYFKPYGDHLVYSKKDLNDMDAMVFHEWLNLGEDTKECTLGFDPDKILSHWNPEELTGALKKSFNCVSEEKDITIVESGRNFSFGGFMGMDSITLAETFGSELLIVADGDVHLILDKVLAVQKCVEGRAKLKGVVINKVNEEDREKIETEVPPVLDRASIKLLGILPNQPIMERGNVELVLDKLNAKLVAGSEGLDNQIDIVQVGALSANQAMKMPTFYHENKMLITGGDRVDLIFASLNTGTAGIILTNNILPHPKVMAKADDLNIPIISVAMDTYTTAKAVDAIISEIRPDEEDKKQIIKAMAKKELDIDAILE